MHPQIDIPKARTRRLARLSSDYVSGYEVGWGWLRHAIIDTDIDENRLPVRTGKGIRIERTNVVARNSSLMIKTLKP